MALVSLPAAAGASGTAILMDARHGRVLSIENPLAARSWSAAPGSTLKPFSVLALLEANKLTARDEYVCPGKLVLNGRSLNCSHPPMPLPMNAARAIAYSCNCAVAHFAERFGPDELSNFLRRAGLKPAPMLSRESCQLQALGEAGIQVTAFELLTTYRRLAARVAEPRLAPILEGLEGAVEFGTAQAARLAHIRVAGKTGSVQGAAWFAGFAPSRAPEVAVVVLVQGRSGGADAAPVAGKILRGYFAERA
jgi:penicillin-binding protein 2